MSIILLTEQASNPSTPSANKVKLYMDNQTIPRLITMDDNGIVTPQGSITNASTAAVSGGYSADTYLAGSEITMPAGAWRAKQAYRVTFDMVKTNAGTAAFTVNIRMGTLGTTGDASILSLAFAVGTAAIDTGIFELMALFRTVGAGTTAVIAAILSCRHHLAATGLITTGASGNGIITGTSAGFNSTTQTKIGISVNGGASFSGTNTYVLAELT